jgi:hypothetical protein
MSSAAAAPCAAVPLSPARAEASRRNGAMSRGPKTPEGKARSAQNALKHGLRAQKHVVLPGEDAAEFQALEAALLEELAPEGALQTVLARRVVAATWRLERAERLEAELFAEERLPGRSLGLALIRDCNGARSFDTLLRYRGGTLAELWRALRTLKALQAEAASRPHEMRDVAPALPPAPHPSGPTPAPASEPAPVPALALAHSQLRSQPNEPADGEAGVGWGAEQTAPGAIAPPRECRQPAAPAQPSFRSTP